MLQRQNLPPQPSPTASHHHGIMYGNNMAGNPCGALSGPSYGCSSTTWTPPTTHPTPCQTYGQPIPHYPPHLGPRPPSFGGSLPPPPGGNPFCPPSPRPLHPPSTFPPPLHRLAIQTSPGPSTRPLSPNTNRVQPWRRSLRHHPRRGVRPAQGHNAHRVYSANGHRGTRHRSRPPPPLHARTVEQLVVASPRPRRRSPHRCRKVDAGISVCCWTTQPNPTTAPRPGRPRPPCSHAGGRLDHQTSSHEATHQQDLRLPHLPPTHHYGRSGLRGHHTPASATAC